MGGEHAPQGLPAWGDCSRPPFAGSSESFGSYKAKGAGPFCLHS